MMDEMKKPSLGIMISDKPEAPPEMESSVTFKAPAGIELPNVEEGSRFNMEAQFEKAGDQIKLVSFGGKDLDGVAEEKEPSLEEEGASLRDMAGKAEQEEGY